MASMDDDVRVALFMAFARAQAGEVGLFRIDASNPNGVQGLVALAVDEVAYLRHIEPALRQAGLSVARLQLGRGAL